MKKIVNIIAAFVLLVIGGVTVGVCQPGLHASDLSGDKLDAIKQSGKIVLGTSADYPPYEFHATIDGKDEIVGFDIEIGRAIAKDLGVELEIKDMSFDGLLPALQSGTIDMIISGMSETPERKKSVDFTIPYFHNDIVMLVLKDNASQLSNAKDFKGKKIGAQQASLQEEAAYNIPDVQVRAISNLLNLVTEVKQKNIDGMVVEEAIAASIVKQNNGSSDLQIVKIPEISTGMAGSSVAIQKGNPELLRAMDATIERLLKDNKVNEYYAAATDLAENGTKDTDKQSYFQKYGPMLLRGAAQTVGIAFFSVLIGLVLGMGISLAKTSSIKILSLMASAYVELIRGTPLLIQLYIVFYFLPYIGIKLPPFFAGTIAVSLNSAAYIAEIIRAGINAVDKGQTEAGRSLGMSNGIVMRKIVVPQAVKNILPALGNEFVTIIKESSIVSIIGVSDLMYAANTIRGNTYQPFKPLIIATIIYFMLTFTLSKVIGIFERKLNRNATN